MSTSNTIELRGQRRDDRIGEASVARTGADARSMRARYDAVREQTERLCRPLETEDYVVSSMPDVSPTKWHLAHTSWFFETFVLAPHAPGYRSPDPRYAFLFNSYYVQAGERHCRAQRGFATRPSVAQVFAYRVHVDQAMRALIDQVAGDAAHPAMALVELGLHHEQQHQELLLTDIKHVFWMNPLRPTYRNAAGQPAAPADAGTGEAVAGGTGAWRALAGGVKEIGHAGAGFAYDNEAPRHRVYLEPFELATALVTNGDYLAFIEEGGYRRPELWLSAGWATAQAERWEGPLYWERGDDGWTEFTLGGSRPLTGPALRDPVSHVSYFEADAFARWAGHRLPTEAEWEVAAQDAPLDGGFVDAERFHPAEAPAPAPGALGQLYGEVWQWTASPYVGYPGYVAAPGAIGEYNGKWMSDQWVLRGASCATPRSHARVTYRNFFPSPTRWQFSGIRLARGAQA